eukprot:4659822-Prymnesium_polylepis.1
MACATGFESPRIGSKGIGIRQRAQSCLPAVYVSPSTHMACATLTWDIPAVCVCPGACIPTQFESSRAAYGVVAEVVDGQRHVGGARKEDRLPYKGGA